MHNHRSVSSMSRHLIRNIVVLSILTLISTLALADCETLISHFYLGGDAALRHMHYKNGYGHNLFRDELRQGNFYIGAKINCNVGLELGYETSRTRARETTITEGEVATGIPVPQELAPARFRNQARISGPHINLIGFYAPCEDSCLKLIGSIGTIYARSTYIRRTVALNGVPVTTYRLFSESSLIPRVMGGLQYQLFDCLAARGTLIWENTKALHAHNTVANSAFVCAVKPESSIIVGIGLVLTSF